MLKRLRENPWAQRQGHHTTDCLQQWTWKRTESISKRPRAVKHRVSFKGCSNITVGNFGETEWSARCLSRALRYYPRVASLAKAGCRLLQQPQRIISLREEKRNHPQVNSPCTPFRRARRTSAPSRSTATDVDELMLNVLRCQLTY